MRRSLALRTALCAATMIVIAACGTSGSEDEDSTPTEPEPEATEEEAPEPEPEEQETSEEDEADGTDPGIAALEGSWTGPTNESGSNPRLTFFPNGIATLESDGFACNGEVDPVDDGLYVLTMSDCVVPLPAVQLELADDGESFVDDDDSEWFPEEETA